MSDEQKRQRAARLYEKARLLHEKGEYGRARALYEESLGLHEDADVRAAYRKLRAAIEPM